jgi:uncharacterized protein (TIGR02246 family)
VSDEAEIRALIERWAEAVQRRDLEAVVADHAPDMLMFDVPPPNALAGIDAYRESWGPFFENLGESGVFEIEQLDITAGDSVAFAAALLRCGTADELKRTPDTRLRLTVGLRKDARGWTIAHEHHSFPLAPSE